MSRNETAGLSRRGLFRVGVSAAAAAAASAPAAAAPAQEEFDYDGWFDDVPNFDGTVDRTGQESVVVTVGAGGELVFDPPAIHVDPGTTVVFEWDQGFHNVVEQESGERYGSELSGEPGTTYEVTYETDGISTYICEPHVEQGMKGAVAVGSGEGVPDVTEGETVVGGTDGGDDASGDDGENGGGDSDGDGTGGDGDGESNGDGGETTDGGSDGSLLALFGVALVLAFLSPVALAVLLYRQATREPEGR